MKTILYLLAVLGMAVIGFYFYFSKNPGDGPARMDPFMTDPSCGAPSATAQRYTTSDLGTDPIVRAGTVSLYSDNYMGHGFVVDHGGLFFVTAEHVADIALGNCAYLYFPGGTFSGLARFSAFRFANSHEHNDDELAYFEINGDLLTRVNRLISSGTIRPMVVSKEIPSRGDAVAIPDYLTGDYSYYAIYQHQSGRISLVTNGDYGLVCSGRSGSPVLLVENGVVTNKVIATISSIDSDAMVENDQGGYCGYITYAILF